ncbi:PTS sugar transporter subunit IIB [Clostridium sp. NSJ-49]|uniref:PTS system lactose/cellobiose-specific transporter subunit IIB n=1 Tax=Clostridium disporicum TaxID=84024 RepID=A0A174B5S4_9CLOT|nr:MULTISPECIES: PTS sugar transporter subunit IIB [Clostridium]MBC5624573.1 PTS sugar transporter subunit IIB [Clostridium sp. NSJ-49]CUN95549.1 PTS system lactose/cellobiose-specific transporter subunit IIB [Clostridium disporicum]
MKKILLVCEAGMSTSILLSKMREYVKVKKVDIDIKALPITECEEVINDVDIVLLSPQVRFQMPQVNALVNGRVPVKVIDVILYGMMNEKAILDQVLNLLDKK